MSCNKSQDNICNVRRLQNASSICEAIRKVTTLRKERKKFIKVHLNECSLNLVNFVMLFESYKAYHDKRLICEAISKVKILRLVYSERV